MLKEVVTSEEYAEWNRKQLKIGKMNDFDFVAHVLEQSYARAVAPHSDLLTVKGTFNSQHKNTIFINNRIREHSIRGSKNQASQ